MTIRIHDYVQSAVESLSDFTLGNCKIHQCRGGGGYTFVSTLPVSKMYILI
jgi:hypothetical protein